MRRLAITLLATALVLAACSGDDDTADEASSTAPTTASGGTSPSTVAAREPLDVPPEVTAAADDWPLPGRDYANSRARDDSTITRANVGALDVAWSVPLPGSAAFGNAATAPVILDDTVYVQDLQSNVWAIALDTGAVKWTHTYNRFQIGPNGVAVGYGKVFVAAGDKAIAALDLATGEELWSTAINVTPTEGIDMQPTVAQGLVYASTVPISIAGQYKGGDRGTLWALDAETGAKVWSFDTIESPDLWGHPDINSGGGAWFTPAVDVARGLVYWGIGNPAPFPGTKEFPNGSSRPGDNLYTVSVVALDARTGALAWYHQAIAHDLFDHDLQLTSMATVDEGTDDERELVIGTGKLGRVIGIDPTTAQVAFDTKVGVHENGELTELPGPTKVLPGLLGGVLTPNAVTGGVVYVPVVNAPSNEDPTVDSFLAGAALGTMPGQLVAVDAANGEIVWDTEIDGDPLGGALVMGDLVFTATFAGTIVVVDRETGDVVRTFAAPGGINGWPAASRDTIVWPVGLADPPSLVAYRVPSG